MVEQALLSARIPSQPVGLPALLVCAPLWLVRSSSSSRLAARRCSPVRYIVTAVWLRARPLTASWRAAEQCRLAST